MIFFPLTIFALGTIIGSFLNVVIFRASLTLGVKGSQTPSVFPARSLLGRSHCPHCHKQLTWWQLIPIFSYIALRGQCANCKQPISVQYPLVEMGYGLLFLMVWLPMGLGTLDLRYLTPLMQSVILALLLVLAVIDLRTFLLPDRYMTVLAMATVVYLWLAQPNFLDSLYGFLAGGGFILFLYLVTRGQGIGFGDVKLAAVLGAATGLLGVTTLLFIAFIIGGIFGSYLLLRGKASLKTAIPFGPFLAGAGVLILLQPHLPAWVVSLLLGV